MNNETLIERHFARIGVEAVLVEGEAISIDVRRRAKDELFVLAMPHAAEVKLLDANRADRHLLLLVDHRGTKSRFLCGHDERHWFVAAIPEDERGVTDVAKAKAALQPPLVRTSALSLKSKHRLRRRNRVYVRQGEWYFVPARGYLPPASAVLRHEALSRGQGSKPHFMEFAYRAGGTQVYVNSQHPNGLTTLEYEALPEAERRPNSWRVMQRDAQVFAMGRITHSDHATINLRGWHRVLMNTENRAAAMRHVAFLD